MEFTTAEIDFKDFLLNVFKTDHESVMFLTLFVDNTYFGAYFVVLSKLHHKYPFQIY